MAGGDFVLVHGSHACPWNRHFFIGYLLHIFSERRSQVNSHFGSLLNGVLFGPRFYDSVLDQIIAGNTTTLLDNIKNNEKNILILLLSGFWESIKTMLSLNFDNNCFHYFKLILFIPIFLLVVVIFIPILVAMLIVLTMQVKLYKNWTLKVKLFAQNCIFQH